MELKKKFYCKYTPSTYPECRTLQSFLVINVPLSKNGITWVYFSVTANTIGIYQVLEAICELVCLIVGWWSLISLHPIEDGRDS